jgi:hypothetical protein
MIAVMNGRISAFDNEAAIFRVGGPREPRMVEAKLIAVCYTLSVGLGIAANACAVLEAARDVEGRVHLVSFDRSSDPIRFALDHAEALQLHAALAPNRSCALATYSRATHVRVGLLLAGFYVGRGRAAGAKEETTVAANQLEWIEDPLDRKRLTRIESSSSAEPLTKARYRQAPLTEESRGRLRSHPQFV